MLSPTGWQRPGALPKFPVMHGECVKERFVFVEAQGPSVYRGSKQILIV